jgi:hypothetical protein
MTTCQDTTWNMDLCILRCQLIATSHNVKYAGIRSLKLTVLLSDSELVINMSEYSGTGFTIILYLK